MTTTDDANKLSTIRDILFGEQAREDEVKRNNSHKELKASIGQLQQETQNQFQKISNEIEKLQHLISNETDQRLADNKAATHQTMLLQQTQSQLRQDLTQSTAELSKKSREYHEELSEKLEQAAKELRSDKTDRGDLAKMLRGMAEQLANEQ